MNPLFESWISAGPDYNDKQAPYWTISQAKCRCNITTVSGDMVSGCDADLTYEQLELRAELMAAAPSLARALLKIEQSTFTGEDAIECCLEVRLLAQHALAVFKNFNSKVRIDLVKQLQEKGL